MEHHKTGQAIEGRFRDLHESMGLSDKWIGNRYGVSEDTVIEWDKGTMPVPNTVTESLTGLKHDFNLRVGEQAGRGCRHLYVPRTDAALPDGCLMPAEWYRTMAMRVSEMTGAPITYLDSVS